MAFFKAVKMALFFKGVGNIIRATFCAFGFHSWLQRASWCVCHAKIQDTMYGSESIKGYECIYCAKRKINIIEKDEAINFIESAMLWVWHPVQLRKVEDLMRKEAFSPYE